MEHTKHIWRAVLALIAAGAIVTLGRSFLIPKSFGKFGFYRADSLDEYEAMPVRHGGRESCRECHDDEYDEQQGGKHARVQCEVCHAPLATHVKDGQVIADMAKPMSWRVCAHCHLELRARPGHVPQIRIREHLVKHDAIKEAAAIPDAVCYECHPPHDPVEE